MSERDALVETGEATLLPKAMLTVVAGAMKRSLASALASGLIGSPAKPSTLLIGLFQHEAYFLSEGARYSAFAATGATVVVGYPGAPAEPAPRICGINTAGRSELAEAWLLVALSPTLGAALVAIDEHRGIEGRSLEAARLFSARWSFRRDDAIDLARSCLAPLRARLADRTAAEVERVLRDAEQLPTSAGEEQLATAIETIVSGLGTTAHQVETPELRERDLLTGLPNDAYLERWLGSRSSAVSLVALLLDVDDLGALNARRGEEAGDAALVAIGRCLSDECRQGELLIRLLDDEFLLLARSTPVEAPEALGERFVVAARALRLPYPFADESVTVTAAFDVAAARQIDLVALRARVAELKHDGKNRSGRVSR